MLPLIIGGLCAAVSFAAGAMTSHAAGEKDRQAAKHCEKVNTALIHSRDALEKRYHALSDCSQERLSDLEWKLAESELEKDILYLVVRLQNSLLLLMHGIDRDPSFAVLLQFQEAVTQTNLVLTQLGEGLIPIPRDYFSRNLTRAKLKLAKGGGALSQEQKVMLHKILPTVSDGMLTCPSCHEPNAVMKRVAAINCLSCSKLIDLVANQDEIQWQQVSVPHLVASGK